MQVPEHNFCIVREQHHKHPPTIALCPSSVADSGHANYLLMNGDWWGSSNLHLSRGIEGNYGISSVIAHLLE